MFPPSWTNWVKAAFFTSVASWSLGPHHNDSMAEVGLNERVQSWDGKRWLQCPKCETNLFGYQADSSEFIVTRTAVSTDILKLVHRKCTSANPGKVFFCVGCGARSVKSPSQLLNRHCKCRTQKETNSISTCAPAPEALTTGSVPSPLQPPVETCEEHTTASALIEQDGALPRNGL